MTGFELSIIFLAISLGTAAVMLVVRELLPQRSAYVSQQLAAGNADAIPDDLLLPRVPQRGSGPIGRFDAWFDRLILETNTQFSALAAMLCMLAAGLLLGGGLFVWPPAATPSRAAHVVDQPPGDQCREQHDHHFGEQVAQILGIGGERLVARQAMGEEPHQQPHAERH